jgi:hypothetical protein
MATSSARRSPAAAGGAERTGDAGPSGDAEGALTTATGSVADADSFTVEGSSGGGIALDSALVAGMLATAGITTCCGAERLS